MTMIVGTASLAAGQDPPPPVASDEGLLVLELGSVDRFARYDPAGLLLSTQDITVQGCKVSLDTGGAVLVSVNPLPSNGSVGLFDDGLGVKVNGPGGGNGQPCGRADGPDEGLVLDLAGDLAGTTISRAELDIEGKFNADVEARLFLGGAPVGGVFTLSTGARSDSGPDSADGDNYRWEIEPGAGLVFDMIELTVSSATPSGAFSLEGGADGTAAGSLGIAGSAFQLVETFDGIIDCGEPTFTTGDGTTAPKATFVRGDDDDKNDDPCSQLIGYNLTSTVTATEQTVTFEFETEEAPSWFGTFDWTPEAAVIPVPATQVDANDDGLSDGPLIWCLGFSGVDVSTGNPLPVMPAGESWCLITQESTLQADGEMQVTQTIYGESDPSFGRTN